MKPLAAASVLALTLAPQVAAAAVALSALAAGAGEESPKWETIVINLDRRPDRLNRFLGALQEKEPWLLQGQRLCRVAGRDGHTLSKQHGGGSDASLIQRRSKQRSLDTPVPAGLENAQELVDDGWVTPDALEQASRQAPADWPAMSAGGVGLYLGHAAAWRHVVRRGLDYGMVFEDDLTLFASNFKTQVASLLGGRDSNASKWDLLYLQRCNDNAWKKQRVDGDGSDRNPTHEEVAWSAELELTEGQTVPCTGAYIVSQQGARKLLQQALPAREQLDKQLGYVHDLRRSALSPPVAQCQEVYQKGSWEYRDTDVQQPVQDLKTVPASLKLWLDSPTKGSKESLRGNIRPAWATAWLDLLEVSQREGALTPTVRNCDP